MADCRTCGCLCTVSATLQTPNFCGSITQVTELEATQFLLTWNFRGGRLAFQHPCHPWPTAASSNLKSQVLPHAMLSVGEGLLSFRTK
ncbi:hypothetical protein WJX79_006271 [Trebouxia sp. C0005]